MRLPEAEQQVDDVIPATIPRRTMGSAVPVSTGSTFFLPTAAISHQLRSQIIAGNDVNLVQILLGTELSDGRVMLIVVMCPSCLKTMTPDFQKC